MTTDSNSVTHVEHLLGRVKWFNNKAGYGFITVTDGSRSGTDVFVHHSSVNVENQQYKYLVQGEYVEFDLIKVDTDKHEWQASRVSGVKGGKLMCETRHELMVSRTEYKTSRPSGENVEKQNNRRPDSRPQQQSNRRPVSRPQAADTRMPRQKTNQPRDGEKKEWTLVVSKNKV